MRDLDFRAESSTEQMKLVTLRLEKGFKRIQCTRSTNEMDSAQHHEWSAQIRIETAPYECESRAPARSIDETISKPFLEPHNILTGRSALPLADLDWLL